jgi:Tetratricopeptide repeat
MAKSNPRNGVKNSQRIRLFSLALIVATAVAYLPAWNGKPIWDDNAHITQPELRSWHGLVEVWTQVGATQQYYPLVHSVFWIEQKLWGDSVLGYHLINIFLHGFGASNRMSVNGKRYCHQIAPLIWRTTIARNPDCWMAYSNLGSFLSAHGDANEAIADFRKALEIWPNQSKDHNNLGKALVQKGRIAEAMDHFQTALRVSPDDPDTESNIGAASLQQGDADEAISHLRRAVESGRVTRKATST